MQISRMDSRAVGVLYSRSVNSADFVSKILIPLAVSILSVMGAWLVARLGKWQKQVQTVELATKRIAFWDTYLRIALSTTASDPDAQAAFEREVRSAIQRVRNEAAQEFSRISWSQLVAKKRLPAAELRGSRRFQWIGCWRGHSLLFSFCIYSALPGSPLLRTMTLDSITR